VPAERRELARERDELAARPLRGRELLVERRGVLEARRARGSPRSPTIAPLLPGATETPNFGRVSTHAEEETSSRVDHISLAVEERRPWIWIRDRSSGAA
jgi:hypothetical protein